MNELNVKFMAIALAEAVRAAKLGEVPIGAVVVDKGQKILASAGNRSIEQCDPAGHAEIIALRAAGLNMGNYRLLGTTIYVTLEPCLMCIGAMIHARIERLVFGAADPKTGAVMSQYSIGRDGRLNHEIIVEGGVCANESSEVLRRFFRDRRGKKHSK